MIKGCVHSASLLFESKITLWNYDYFTLFHFKTSFYSKENQILEFSDIQVSSLKQKIHFS